MQQDPSLQTADSLTQRIGGPPSERFTSVDHRIGLLSLDNAFSREDLGAWQERLLKVLDRPSGTGLSMVGELKIDGNALALSYRNGVLEPKYLTAYELIDGPRPGDSFVR